MNIFVNAIRYTPEEGCITIRSRETGEDNELIIEDTGIGIEEKDLPNIFSEFYRSESAKQIVNFGTGLGLSIVKQVVEKYNGEIDVKSEIGKGTAFTVSFPKE